MSDTPIALGSRIVISGYDPSETVDDLMWLSAESFAQRIGAMYAAVYEDFYSCRINAAAPESAVEVCLLFKRDVTASSPLVNAINRDFDGTYRLTEDGREGIEPFMLPDPKALEAMIFGGSTDFTADLDAITGEETTEAGTVYTKISRLDANKLAAAVYGEGDARTEYKYKITAKGSADRPTLEISREARTIVCIGCGVY